MTTKTLGGWLVHVLREADGALSLEEALHVILDSMNDYFPSQSVAVLLIDDDTKELRIKISRQISYTFVKQFRQSGPGATAERVVLEQEPMLLNNLEHASPVYAEIKLEHDFTSAVLAPVVSNQRGVGYIFCDRANGEQFNETDLLHLQVIGYLIGNMMEKFALIQAGKKLSVIDDATGALQYKAFIPALATELQRAATHAYPLTLALLAVDAFRDYVNTYGIDRAHAMLAEVVKVVKADIRDMDVLARFGADEFILCLSGMTVDESRAVLEKIRKDVTAGVIEQGDTEISVMIGALGMDGTAAARQRVQDLLAAVGKQLVAAKTGAGQPLVLTELKSET